MIVSFSFSNFKSIREEVTLSFEASKSRELEEFYVVRPTPKLRLLKVAAIYGANASGKSNVLLALEFLRQLTLSPASDKLQPINFNQFAFTEAGDKGPSTFRLDFVERGVRYSYTVSVSHHQVLSEDLYFYQPKKAVLYSRVTDPADGSTSIQVGSKLQVAAEDLRLWQLTTLPNNSVLGSFLKTNIKIPELEPVITWFQERLTAPVWPKADMSTFVSRLIRSNTIEKRAVVSLLEKADTNIRKLEFSKLRVDEPDNEFNLTFFHTVKMEDGREATYGLPYAFQSAGTRRYYEYAGLLAYLLQEQRVVPIDEIESSLHPELLKHFLLLFLRNSKDSQLIFTTHQRDLMRETDMLRNDIFHFTEKRPDGSTDLYSFTDFDPSVVRSDSSLYNAYKIGKLGAVPEPGDAYIPTE
ncbi:AAA family ATPase [Neolewinella sp.]|uniref:AAA family ATPase n=1 Tax=Neolewinella sp. TaxID=2993543 RepID=UPI003B529317